MNIDRRTLLASTAAAAALAACQRSPTFAESVAGVLAAHFGEEVANSPAGRDFTRDVTAYLTSGAVCASNWGYCQTHETQVLTHFFQSTDYLANADSGYPLGYAGLFHPYSSTCANQFAVPV